MTSVVPDIRFTYTTIFRVLGFFVEVYDTLSAGDVIYTCGENDESL